jgi:hypothetical protein
MLTVHRGKGGKDRAIPLPDAIISELNSHLNRVKNLHGLDLKNAFDGVFMPESFDKKICRAGIQLVLAISRKKPYGYIRNRGETAISPA